VFAYGRQSSCAFGTHGIGNYITLAAREQARQSGPFDKINNGLKSGFSRGSLHLLMSLAELKNNVMALPESERHDFVVWLNRLEQNYGDIPEEALAEMTAEVWDQDDRHAPPTHPTR
jgi:hypothetical protein